MDSKIKLRPLYVAKILLERTDENNLLTIAQILQILHDEYNIDSYRATIKDDITLLMDSGMDIEFVKSSQNKYHVVSRDFDVAELKIIIDAVASSKFITKEKSEALISKLSKLAGPFAEKDLVRNMEVEGRLKAENEYIYYIVDAINDAINQQKKISFQYFTYTVRKEKKLKHSGEYYIFSPYKLVWNGDYYYMVGYSDKHNGIGVFRIDRIAKQPKILKEKAFQMPESFDIEEYLCSMFRMYNTDRKEVELVCDNSVIDTIIDRFGIDTQILANDLTSFRVIIKSAINKVFFSWIFGFEGKVQIKSPVDVREQYEKMLRNAAEKI